MRFLPRSLRVVGGLPGGAAVVPGHLPDPRGKLNFADAEKAANALYRAIREARDGFRDAQGTTHLATESGSGL